MSSSPIVKEGVIYKGTTASNLVVARKLELYEGNKFVTFHDFDKDPGNKKTWYIDGKCELIPKTSAEIATAQGKRMRPNKTWTITAKAKGAGEPISLFMFTLSWPKRWAAKGYTTFTLGCESLEEARAWHQHFAASLHTARSQLSMKKGKSLAVSELTSHVSSEISIVNEKGKEPRGFGANISGIE
eukprot:gene12259-15405_t